MTSIERYVGQSTIAFIYDVTSLTRNVAWTSVIHECMNLVGPKYVHLRKLLASVNIMESALIKYMASNTGCHKKVCTFLENATVS